MNKRGIILDANDISFNEKKLTFRPGPNPNLLKHAVLYWDKIAFPHANFMFSTNIPDIEYLKSAGVAQDVHFAIDGQQREFGFLYGLLQLTALDTLNAQNPGMWTMGEHAVDFIKKFKNTKSAQFFEITLNAMLPTPPGPTPLDEILELKLKRKDEFSQLRIAVDELVDQAMKWEQVPRGENAVISHLENIIKDIRNSTPSQWNQKSSLSLSFSIPDMVLAGVSGYEFGEKVFKQFGIPGLVPFGGVSGAVVGATLSGIRFERKIGNIPNVPSTCKNFTALYYIERDFPGTLDQDKQES